MSQVAPLILCPAGTLIRNLCAREYLCLFAVQHVENEAKNRFVAGGCGV